MYVHACLKHSRLQNLVLYNPPTLATLYKRAEGRRCVGLIQANMHTYNNMCYRVKANAKQHA